MILSQIHLYVTIMVHNSVQVSGFVATSVYTYFFTLCLLLYKELEAFQISLFLGKAAVDYYLPEDFAGSMQ